jgi:hypothetical protein
MFKVPDITFGAFEALNIQLPRVLKPIAKRH